MLLAILSGILTALSMPGFLSGVLIWFSLIPLLKAMERKSPLWCGFLSFLYFYTHISISFYWVFPTLTENFPEVFGRFPGWVGGVVFFLMGIIEALPFLGFGILYGIFSKRVRRNPKLELFFVPSLYLLFEYLRGIGDLGFTGGRLSDALYKNVGIVQLASVGGTLLLVFIIVLVNTLFYILMRKRYFRLLYIFMVLGVIYTLDAVIGWYLPLPENGSAKIVALQPNVPVKVKYSVSEKELLEKFTRLTQNLRNALVVTPEAFFMTDISRTNTKEVLERISSERNLRILVGFPTFGKKKYNQVSLIDGKFSNQHYAKVRLFPFVEKLPYPFIFRMFSFLKALDYFDPGEKYTVFKIENFPPFSVQICFESYFPEVSRVEVRNGADFLIVVTNDGWFHYRTALIQHFSQIVFRAVETRRDFLQVANTGITGKVDKYGRILKIIKPGEEASCTFEMSPSNGRTIYTLLGDYMVYISLGILLFCILMSPSGKSPFS
ncbi:MAG: apolipoprotein N-acyltransferase [Thermotoga sp.]|nr:MAG: apolipoprotein N-acyltransferase [Thermotoga sp.]